MSKEKQPKDPAEHGKEIKTAADLIQDAHNYRKHSDTNKARIRKSIDEAGLGRSVVVDADGVLVAGNGVQQVIDGDTPVRVVETDGTELVVVKRTDLHTGDPRRKTLAFADNATADDVEWDFEAIEADGWTEESAGGWGVEWPADEEGEQQKAQEDDFDPDKPVETVCKKGDIWKLGNHRLMCGDSTDAASVALLMDGEKADMCFTDPPYGVSIGTKNKLLKEKVAGGVGNAITEDIENDTASADELHDILVKCMTNVRENCKDDASYFVTAPQGGDLCMMMMMMMHAGLKVRHVLMWLKNAPTFSLGRLDYDYQHEPIFYTWTKNHHNYRAGKFRTSVWTFDKPRKCDLHPTMKPVGLVSNCMLDTTKEGDNIIDLFGGSGTTLIAAEQLDRKCYMMELDPHYCDVIIARWEKLTGNKAEKLK